MRRRWRATGSAAVQSIPIFDRAESSRNGPGAPGSTGWRSPGTSLRRGAISSGVAAGVHIASLKQFSGHASLKSLEEYVELDELRHNHPLKDVL
jgi:hypothetical protein